MKKAFYLSTTIPYVNATPHIGHALEFVQADARVRYERLLGKDVFFLSGSDENSLKNVQAAEKEGKSVEEFVAVHAEEFKNLKEILNISFDDFIRTTELRHFAGAKKLWSACDPEDIYKKKYKGLYCVGCEAFYTPDELIDGILCPDHKKPLEEVEEENYFFRLSRYQKQIEEILEKNTIVVYPDFRKNEILAFVKKGLEDFSISRSTQRAKGWGVPVPGDETQIMYVWFDALANYISALGYAENAEAYQKYWIQETEREVVHVLGKGVARFHLLYWIGMLLSAKIALPTTEFVHGYITVNGEKMSKSLGNVFAPSELVEKYGIDAVRYYFLRAVSAYQDGDYSSERMVELYTSDLVNGIGNLTSRVLTMLEKYGESQIPAEAPDIFSVTTFWKEYDENIQSFHFDQLLAKVKDFASVLDGTISEQKPWEKAKAGENIDALLYQLAEGLRHLGLALFPVLPQTGEKILSQLGQTSGIGELYQQNRTWGILQPRTQIQKGGILFPRLS